MEVRLRKNIFSLIGMLGVRIELTTSGLPAEGRSYKTYETCALTN